MFHAHYFMQHPWDRWWFPRLFDDIWSKLSQVRDLKQLWEREVRRLFLSACCPEHRLSRRRRESLRPITSTLDRKYTVKTAQGEGRWIFGYSDVLWHIVTIYDKDDTGAILNRHHRPSTVKEGQGEGPGNSVSLYTKIWSLTMYPYLGLMVVIHFLTEKEWDLQGDYFGIPSHIGLVKSLRE